MPRYVVNAATPDTCLIVESADLVLDLGYQWARFGDDNGIVLAVPREHVHSIQRIDDEDTPPAADPASS